MYTPLLNLAVVGFCVAAPAAYAQTLNHSVGAFNVDSSSLLAANRDGITVAFLYGPPPLPTSTSIASRRFAQALHSAHIKIVTAGITAIVRNWECHRTWTVARPPRFKRNTYCDHDLQPDMDDAALLRAVTEFSQRVRGDSDIIGFWIRDDMPDWDEGTAGAMLANIRKLLPAEIPTVCGFGAAILPRNTAGSGGVTGGGWVAAEAADYSPEACNYVAIYAYAVADRVGKHASADYNWKMTELLRHVLSSLRQHGWSPSRSPLIGVAQAYAGLLPAMPTLGVTMPSVRAVQEQSTAFCTSGATAIVYYAYGLSAFLQPETPTNSPGLSLGVRAGANACRQIWSER